MQNYIKEILVKDCGDKWKIIPENGCPTRFHEIEFKGWKNVIFICDNSPLNEMLTLASQTMKIFINMYQDKFAFTLPQLVIPSSGSSIIIKVGMMELEEYDRRYGIKEENENP